MKSAASPQQVICYHKCVSTRPDISAAADYALRVIDVYDRNLSAHGISWAGASVLEIGPGHDFAPQILMVDRGAKVTVVDPFLSTWAPDYHPTLYREVRSLVGKSPALDRVIEQGGYDGVITTIAESAERMGCRRFPMEASISSFQSPSWNISLTSTRPRESRVVYPSRARSTIIK